MAIVTYRAKPGSNPLLEAMLDDPDTYFAASQKRAESEVLAMLEEKVQERKSTLRKRLKNLKRKPKRKAPL